MMNAVEEQKSKLYGSLTVYRGRGAYLRRLEQFVKAKAAYDEAFKNHPDDVKTLTGRSQVCADAVQPAQAYADAELALKLEPRNMNARSMQAKALFAMSDFERSVVMNSRGLRIRRQPPYFREGVNQGIETIQDCIGKNAGPVMTDMQPLIKKIEAEERASKSASKKSKHVSRIPKLEQKHKLTQTEARKHAILSRVLAMKYLGPMAYDKFFLQELVDDPRLKSANAAGSKRLEEIVKETLSTLNDRQEMLRTQRPYYSIRLAERTASKHQTRFIEQMLVREREIGAKTTERQLKKIEKSLREHRIMDVMALAERLQLFLDVKTPRTLPDKDLYLDRLYRAVGEGYLSQHRLSYTLSERGNNRRIAFLMGLSVNRATSYDSVCANYPYKFIDVKVATEKVLATLDMCENATMRCWLMYELSRLLAKQKNFALSKFYAKRCQREAQEIGSVTWWLNGCFVLMSGDMQQGNANEVRVLVEEAYDWTKRLADPERIQTFLAKCAEMASELISGAEAKVATKREEEITAVVPKEQKTEAEVMFKRISTVPVGRRFSVAPRKAGPSPMDTEPERKKERQRGLSIIPGPEKPLPQRRQSKVAGFQEFET